jgi:hypothetical protein
MMNKDVTKGLYMSNKQGLQLNFKDKDGSINLEKKGRILVATFTGSCGDQIANQMLKGVQNIVSDFADENWGFLSNALDYHAATPLAEAYYLQAYTLCHKMGCRYETYVCNSALGLAQMAKLRLRMGIKGPMKSVTFPSLNAAEKFLLNKLSPQQDTSQLTK